MKFLIDGFSKYADAIHIKAATGLKWNDLTGLLAIGDVVYYWLQDDTVGVRYKRGSAISPFMVTAKAIALIASKLGVDWSEITLEVNEPTMLNKDKADIRFYCLITLMYVDAPSDVPLGDIIMKGSTPTYYLK